MTPRVLVVGGVVGALAALLGASIERPWLAVPAGLVLGVIAAAVSRRWLDVTADRLLDQLRTWGQRDQSSVVVTGTSAWRELGAELNRLGQEFDAARHRVVDPLVWRDDLVTAMVSGAVLFGPDGHLVASNPRGRELLDLPDDLRHATVMQAVGSVPLAEAVQRSRAEREPVQVEVDVVGRPLRARVSQVGSDTLITLSDRSWERRVDEVRRNFVVNASHELKTPATAIQALTEALEITVENDVERVPELVGRLRDESERLVRLVHDLLDLRRLEEDSTVQRVEVDLASMIRRTVAELYDRARARDVEIVVEAPDRASLEMDRDDLELIVRNLLANAIQYNKPGGHVEVNLRRADGGASPSEDPAGGAHLPSMSGWQMTVSDTGIGIPSQDLPRVFERFYRVDVARSRQSGGTGLGLSLVRNATERNGGTIDVASLLGEGSTFTVALPDRSPG